MHVFHRKNLFALLCLLLLTAPADAAPANHNALMADEDYKKAFEEYTAAEQKAEKYLDAKDFAALRKSVQEEMEQIVKTTKAAGFSDADAWSCGGYPQGIERLNLELTFEWLRRNAEGIQGLYRMQSKAYDGWMTVQKEKKANLYAVHVVANQKKEPFNSGDLNGVGTLKGKTIQIADEADEDKNPVSITFNGEKATVSESEAFKKSGLLGAGVSFDGDFLREKKTAKKDFSAEEKKRMGVFLSNFTETGMMNFTAEEVLSTDNPYEMIRFGIWHNFINNKKSSQPCTAQECQWGSLTMDCSYVKDSLQRYFGYDLKQCISASSPDSNSPGDKYHFDGKRYHFEGAAGEAVYHARVDEARQGADGLMEMKGIVCNADDEKDILGSFTALARPHTWKGKDTFAIVSLKTQFRE